MIFLGKEKAGNKRIIHFFGLKFEYKSKKTKDWEETLYNAYGSLKEIYSQYGYERSIKENACIDVQGNPIPWLTYPAIEYLKQFDYSNKRIFEFGSGNSSLWWAQRAKEVVSVEWDKDWYESRLAFKKPNLKMYLRKTGENYSNAIFEHEGDFEVIVIDGACRNECAKTAVQKIAHNGIIILDNAERANDLSDHKEAVETLKSKNFIQVDFYGFAPLNGYTHSTSLFISRNFDFKTINDVQPAISIGNIREQE